jgi:hypothetical protein
MSSLAEPQRHRPKMARQLDAHALGEALRQAVLAQRFEHTLDPLNGGRALARFPSIDLAVLAFPAQSAPVAANVLFSREHPQGHVAQIAPGFGSVQGIRFDADARDASGTSIAWLPGADWSAMTWQPLWGEGPLRFVAPYPASLLKLMVAVGLGMAVDAGQLRWDEPLPEGGSVQSAVADMISFSCNEATTRGVAALHRTQMLSPLHEAFAARGLHTLRLGNTRADGGWGNAAGAGVGQIQMTAWDTARLFWLLDPAAPAAAWLPADAPALLTPASREVLLHALASQGLHEILSSTALAGVPGWVPGLPAQMPGHWLVADGSAQVGEALFPPGIANASAKSEVAFWHKTGTTENYASDGGIVYGLAPQRRHYIVVMLSNLGSRYAPHEVCATTWRWPAVGAAIDALLKPCLEAQA